MWYILLWFHQDYGRIHQIDCLCRIQAQVQQLHNLASLFCLKESPAISNPRSTLQTPKRPLSIFNGAQRPTSRCFKGLNVWYFPELSEVDARAWPTAGQGGHCDTDTLHNRQNPIGCNLSLTSQIVLSLLKSATTLPGCTEQNAGNHLGHQHS